MQDTYHKLFFKFRSFTACSLLLLGLLSTNCFAQTITMWHPWAKGRAEVSRLAAEYTRRTGVRVEVRSFDPATYNPWTGGTQPDIIGLSYPNRTTIARNARQGRLYNMQTEIQQAWYADLWPGPLEVFALRGADAPGGRTGIYGVPLTAYVRVFIYNRRLFRQAGVIPPRTWSEFLLAAPRLRRYAVPFAGSLDGTYPSFPVIYEWSYLGSHYLLQTYYGRYPYTGERWIRMFNVYEEIQQYEVTNYSAAQLNRTAAARYFLNGNAAIILDGPWFETIRQATAPGFTDWGTFGPPVDRRAPFLPRLPGGVAEGAVINARSRNKAAAIRFLRWMTEPPQQVSLANAMSSIPISQRTSSSRSLDSHLRIFAQYMNYAALDLRYYEEPAVLNSLYTGVRDIIRGRATPSTVLSRTNRLAR